MNPNLKALAMFTLVAGTSATALTFSILYTSSRNAVHNYGLQLKAKDEEVAKLKSERDEAKKMADEEKAKRASSPDTELDTTQCDFTEHELNYKDELKTARDENLELESANDVLQGKVNSGSTKYKSLSAEYTTLINRGNAIAPQLAEKSKKIVDLEVEKQGLEQLLEKLKKEVERLNKQEAETIADSSKKIKELQATITDLRSQLTDTVNHYLNKEDGCNGHYNSVHKRYGKVCYDNGGKVKREIGMAGEENSEVANQLKEQFDKAPNDKKFIDGGVPIKK